MLPILQFRRTAFLVPSLVFAVFLSLGTLTGCATRFAPSDDFKKSASVSHFRAKLPKRTVVFFLVDGLSNQVLRSELLSGELPEIRRHFLATKDSAVFEARTSFPSLTFPAISSLLKGAPVHKIGAVGNSFPYKSEVINFESVRDREHFSELMHGENIFTRLNERGARTVSLDYGLGVDASVSSSAVDLKMGFAAKTEDYLYMDQKKLASLELLLSETSTSDWPDFIFVHLVGLDFISHQNGSRSDEARDYLRALDRSLKPVLRILKESEAKTDRTVVTMMSADHGFSPVIHRAISVEKALLAVTKAELVILNEHRLANIYFKKQASREELESLSRELLRKPGIEIVAFRHEGEVRVLSQANAVAYQYLANSSSKTCPYGSRGMTFDGAVGFCPNALPASTKDIFYPYFLENLSYFFQAKAAPDVVVIPDRDTVFSETAGGFHGGPTQEEVLVPLLMRNSQLVDPKSQPPLWDLLNFL